VDVNVNGIRDFFIGAVRLVLVDHGGPFAVVAHPGHQVPEPRAAAGGEVVARVSEVMEMQAVQAE
jgi:hypothetical protein